MIDGEIYTRLGSKQAVFAYRDDSIVNSNLTITHYASVTFEGNVYIKGIDGSNGRINGGLVRPARDYEIEFFVNKLRDRGYHYNKSNKKVIHISTGRLL